MDIVPGFATVAKFVAKEPRMAASFRFVGALAAVCFSLLLLASTGCQTQTSMVGELPSPNFNGPSTAPPPAIAVAPPAPRYEPPVLKQPQRQAPIAGIPRDWIPPVAPRSWQAIV